MGDTEFQAQVPAGWYPDGSGGQRWWDGHAWSAFTAAGSPVTMKQPNGVATAALVLGLVAMFLNLAFLPSILAIIFGANGLGRSRTYGGAGRVRSLWGIWLGILGAVGFAYILYLNNN